MGGKVRLLLSEWRSHGRADAHATRVAQRTARRKARVREREALRGLPRRERWRAWWRTRPLGVTFTLYLCMYLTVATVVAVVAVDPLVAWRDSIYELEVSVGNGLVEHGEVDSGPYIYDPASQELLPAAELDVPGSEPLAVFIATAGQEAPSSRPSEVEDEPSTVNATLDLVRSGQVRLYDWGLNYNEWYPQEEILGADHEITAENIGRYDEQSRAHRAQSIELFGQMTGGDLAETFGENMVSNTAYYAAPARPDGAASVVATIATGLAPVLSYGGLGWIMFKRFYRVHIAAPLGEMAGAAERIAAGDLDFCLEPVRGRELGRLSRTLEGMRASLLEAQRELWRTAEGRRRLNAAFAHDLRTPITVLKGTIEMARMRADRSGGVGEHELEPLSAQVTRLERYATAMGGLTKLEERPVEREDVDADEAVRELQRHAAEVVTARGTGLRLVCEGGVGADSARETGGASAGSSDSEGAAVAEAADSRRTEGAKLYLDKALVEEVLDNALSNACGHARRVIALRVQVHAGELCVRVIDDGPGFSPEALHRGCDPFYSENKSAEHFGLGLNVSSILCELHGGALTLGNDANGPYGGASVTATFAV